MTNLSGLTPACDLRGDSEQDTKLLREMLEEAKRFLAGFEWCLSIEDAYFAFGVGGVVAVFLLKMVPARPGVDPWLWVVVGDLPPAYIVVEGNPSAADALEGYVDEMSKWVAAVLGHRPMDELIPVNVQPTIENAKNLASRLDFLKAKILPNCRRGDEGESVQ